MATQSETVFQPDFAFPSRQPSAAVAYGHHYASSSSSHYLQSDSSHDLSSLAYQFSQQSIRNESSPYDTGYQVAGPSGAVQYYNQVSVPRNRTTASPHESLQEHQSTVRSRRQSNSRMQCHAAHSRQLASLLDRMVASGEQCSVCLASSRMPQPSTQWEEDETMGEELDDADLEGPPLMSRLSYRRSTDLTANNHGYVSKTIRLRKKHRSDPSRLR